jgi:anaerobic magnesium-protoporphyrin IX monomethyl ester cyclase
MPRATPPEVASPWDFAVPPLSHLALAGPLRQAGFGVHILDAKWDRDWFERVSKIAPRVVAFGVSALTGYSIKDGLLAAERFRALRPEVPIVWGGWHTTFAASQAIEDPRVDYVVRGQGERTFVQLLDALESHQPLHDIAGLTFRDGDRIVNTPDRIPEDLNNFPPPAYDLVQPQRYVQALPDGHRMAHTIFSRGCPFACNFCLDSRQKWLGVSVDRMIADIKFWVEEQKADRIRFYDGNFFLGKPRIVEFCNAIFREKLETKFEWTATAVGNRVIQMDDELLAMLRRSGLASVAIGAESGSDELLERITNKTTVEHTLEAVRRLTRHGISQFLFFIVGYPDEPEEALDDTLQFILELKAINPEIDLNINFAVPLPGSEMFNIAIRKGYIEEPRTFFEWWPFDQGHPNSATVSRQYEQRVKRFLRYLFIAFPARDSIARQSRLISAATAPVRSLARWRLRRNDYRWPVDLRLLDAALSMMRIAAR